MRVMLLSLAAVLAIALVGCSDDGDEDSVARGSSTGGGGAVGVLESAAGEPRGADGALGGFPPSAVPAPGVPAERGDDAAAPPSGGESSLDLQLAGRQVIRTASLVVRVDTDADVVAAADRAALIAESRGGFVEHMSVSSRDDDQRASIVLRVPQSAFREVVSELSALGEVLDQSLGSQDVSGEVVDLEARERTLRTQEARLIDLLGRAEDLQQVLTLERELTRTRTQIEQIEGQLRFIERRVELATVSLELLGPAASARTTPPSASLTLDAGDVEDAARRAQDAATELGGAIDDVVIDVLNGRSSAFVQVRVPRADFANFVGDVERLGHVIAKSVRDPQSGREVDGAAEGEPDARVSMRFEQAEGEDRTGLAVGAAAALVVVASAALAYVALRSRARRRRGASELP